jgi:hypothetical protein
MRTTYVSADADNIGGGGGGGSAAARRSAAADKAARIAAEEAWETREGQIQEIEARGAFSGVQGFGTGGLGGGAGPSAAGAMRGRRGASARPGASGSPAGLCGAGGGVSSSPLPSKPRCARPPRRRRSRPRASR